MRRIIICMAGIILVTGCQRQSQRTDSAHPPDIAAAIQAFQTKQGARNENDYAVPRKLLPLLKPGLSQGAVREILGEPSRVSTNDLGIFWNYGLFYSQFIDIQFGPDGRVRAVSSTIKEEEIAEPQAGGDGKPAPQP